MLLDASYNLAFDGTRQEEFEYQSCGGLGVKWHLKAMM